MYIHSVDISLFLFHLYSYRDKEPDATDEATQTADGEKQPATDKEQMDKEEAEEDVKSNHSNDTYDLYVLLISHALYCGPMLIASKNICDHSSLSWTFSNLS